MPPTSARVVAALRAAPRQYDIVVLAQASMADAADALQDLGVEVLSSPRLGVQALAGRGLMVAAAATFAVIRSRGPAWNAELPMRAQAGVGCACGTS